MTDYDRFAEDQERFDDPDSRLDGASRLPTDPAYWNDLAARIHRDGREQVSAMVPQARGWLSLAERHVGALVALATAATIVLVVQVASAHAHTPSLATTLTPPVATVRATGSSGFSAPHLESILLQTGGLTHDD